MKETRVDDLLNVHGAVVERIATGLVSFETYYEHIERYRLARKYARDDWSVVDLATGSGYGSYYLACQKFAHVLGIDHDVTSVAFAEETYASRINNLAFQVGDAGDIPLADNQVDLFVSYETLEHVPEPRLFVQEIHRVLKSNGIVLLSTPNKHLAMQRGDENPYHISEMFVEDVMKEMERAGFELIGLYGQGLIHQPMTSSVRFSFKNRVRDFIPQSFMEAIRKKILIPSRSGIPAKVVDYYLTAPAKFEDWIAQHEIQTPYKPVSLDLNNLNQAIERYQTFIFEARKRSE